MLNNVKGKSGVSLTMELVAPHALNFLLIKIIAPFYLLYLRGF